MLNKLTFLVTVTVVILVLVSVLVTVLWASTITKNWAIKRNRNNLKSAKIFITMKNQIFTIIC